jgi:hypothetical protein
MTVESYSAWEYCKPTEAFIITALSYDHKIVFKMLQTINNRNL